MLDQYGCYPGLYLSSLTHRPGSPWDKTWRKYGQNAVIPRDLIQAHYRTIVTEARAATEAGKVLSSQGILMVDIPAPPPPPSGDGGMTKPEVAGLDEARVRYHIEVIGIKRAFIAAFRIVAFILPFSWIDNASDMANPYCWTAMDALA